MIEAGTLQLLVSGFDSPEGPAFDRDGNLFFVNWLTSSINRLDPDGNVTEFFNTGGIPAGLAFHPDGSLWVADEGDDIHGLMRITPDGQARDRGQRIRGHAAQWSERPRDRPQRHHLLLGPVAIERRKPDRRLLSLFPGRSP